MSFGKLEFHYFIISLCVRTLFSPFHGVEAKDKTVYGMDCAPGTFVSDKGCQRCPNGTFSDKRNATKCSPCDRCVGRHNEVTKACTSSSNTECSCQSGFYYNAFLFCLKCTQCKRGKGVVRNCTATSDTECELCEKGKTFSSKKSMEKCKPCTRCPKGHIVQEECTRRSDTVCVPEKDRNNSKLPPRKPKATSATVTTTPPTRTRTTKKKRWKTSTKRSSTEPTHNTTGTPIAILDDDTDSDEDSDEDRGLQTALYALIGLLVILVAVLALVCWRKKKRRPRKVAKPGNSEEPSTRTNSTDIIEAVSVENPYSSSPFIGVRQKGPDKMLRDVSYTLITVLSQYLNPGDRWKQLGGHLNFNSTQINNFAMDKGTATQTMLQEWGQKDEATVVALRNTFRKMKWTKEERIVGEYV